LTASAEGLRPAKASVHSRAVAVEGGLSRELSESELACNLSRGPTPQVDSVRIVRRNVYADRVAAGSNQADIPKLCDDNEASAWVSDDQMDRAWVRFEFDQPVQVGEVILRLGSWRTTSWPLRLYADDREVFAGVAPATVGYSTLRFDATRCRTLRLQLAGAPRRGGNAPLIEVTGRADPHGGDDARAAGKFVIHEIELFAPHTPPASPAESTAR
jgi:hypothetical protein